MKLQNYIYQCDACKNKFRAPELLGNPYGEFLLRSLCGEMRYLNAINSVVFSDAGKIVDQLLEKTQITDLGKAKVLHEIFGLACDLASDNTEFKICGNPICPQCHSNDMYSWIDVSHQEIVDIDVPDVTHEHWNKLSYSEKQFQINEAVEKFLADKDNKKIF